MMIQILGKYILPNNETQSLQQLQNINENLSKKINMLQSKVNCLDQQIINQLPGHHDRLQSLKQILNRNKTDINKQLSILNQQQSKLNILRDYVQYYLNEQANQPRALKTKLEVLKQISLKLGEQQQYSLQKQIMDSWTDILIKSLNSKLSSFVRNFTTSININLKNIGELKDMLTDQICLSFIKNLYVKTFTYDVPTYSYILLHPLQVLEEGQMLIIKRTSVIFTSQKAQQNYQLLYRSIVVLNQTSNKIIAALNLSQDNEKQVNREKLIRQQIQNCLLDIKGIVQYILSFLSIQKRKQILCLLNAKNQAQLTIYDILVQLRTKGQGADSLTQNTDILLQKIKQDKSLLTDVLNFLQICQREKNFLSVAFYLCDQMVNKLEEQLEVNKIVDLLEIRESIRLQIHQPE